MAAVAYATRIGDGCTMSRIRYSGGGLLEEDDAGAFWASSTVGREEAISHDGLVGNALNGYRPTT